MGVVTKPEPLGLLVIGTNYRQSPVDFREKVAFVPGEVHGFLQHARQAMHSTDVFMLSTCHRTELYTVATDLQSAAELVRGLLVQYKAIDAARDSKNFYEYHGRSAVEQLFRVAAGIDSQMLGEPQILQQVKDAREMAVRAGVLGVIGEHMLAAAVRSGKRARSETQLAAGPLSVAFAAVSLAHKVFGDLSARAALVVGAGETGGLVARHLREHGIGRLLVANRSIDRARALAAEMRGEPMGLDNLGRALAQVDIAITSTSAPHHLVDARMMRDAMRARHNHNFLVVDIGVPRDVDPAVRNIDNVFLHDVDGLQVMIEQTLVRRRREVPRVEKIIDEEVAHFLDWYHGLQAAPLIKELRGHFEALREQEISRHAAHLSAEQRAAVEEVTRSLLNKLLHRPTKLLREAVAENDIGLRRIEAARELFGLDGRASEDSENDA